MYRVRLASGDEKTYRSIDDMIWDVETGVITRDALLFHAGSQSWVSITRNPRLAVRLKAEPRPGEAPLEFEPLSDVILADALLEMTLETDERKRAVEQESVREDLHGGPSLGLTGNAEIFSSLQPAAPPPHQAPRAPEPPPAPPLAPPPLAPTPIVLPASGPLVPAPPPLPPAAELPEPPLDGDLAPLPGEELDEPPIEYRPIDWKPDRDYRRLLAPVLRIVALVVLVVGAAVAWRWWAARSPAATAPVADSALAPQAIDTIPDSVLAAAVAMMEEAETTDAELLLRRRLGRSPGRPAVTRPAIAGLRAMTAAELRRSYTVAYAGARSDMDSTLAAAGVRAFFAPERFASTDSLRAGRRMVLAARNVLRAYNRAEVQIERAYRDTVAYQVKRMGWGPEQQNEWKARAALKESYESAQLADSLLRSVDAVYALLVAQRGRYDLGPEGILFSDAKAANEYARQSQWLAARLDRFARLGDQGAWPSARRIVTAFQGTRPPVLLQGSL